MAVFFSHMDRKQRTCLFKSHLFMKQQRKDGRETFRLTVLAHEAHAKVDVILGWQMHSRTRNLRTVEKQFLVQFNRVK